MNISILSSQHFSSTQWSGGTTTQLYISPPNASYSDRNFELRISTAKVEVDQATFTALPGFQRKLMILKGEISIIHQGQYSKRLKAFEVDSFSGDWKTTSIGTCTDFNVMTQGLLHSDLYYLTQELASSHELIPQTKCNSLFLYATSGTIYLKLMNENYTLESGNLMVVENLCVSSIFIESAEGFGLVVLEIASCPIINSERI